MLNLNFENVFSFDFLSSRVQSNCNFEAFLVNKVLLLATFLGLVRLIFGILKRIQKQVFNELKQIVF